MIYPKVESLSASADPSRLTLYLISFCFFVFAGSSGANDVEITDAKVSCHGESCRIDVTLKHEDSGWEHYADSWRVVTESGEELGKRVLFHPHVDEQPFTRSLNDVKIPLGTKSIWIEAHDLEHGTSENRFQIDL